MTGNLEDKLRSQFNTINAVGQISTSTGEEVLCTSGNRDTRMQSSRLASAFVETDQLAQSLKLGAVRQVIISQSCNDYTGAPPHGDSIVQSKAWGSYPQNNNGNSLITTTMAPSLQNALLADNVIRDSAQRVLR